jgi:hypothetical protein
LDQWLHQHHSNDPFDAIDPSSIIPAETIDESVIDSAVDLSETGATNNDDAFDVNTAHKGIFKDDVTYAG